LKLERDAQLNDANALLASLSSLEETLKYSVAAADKGALATLDGKTQAFHAVTRHLASIPGQADAARALNEHLPEDNPVRASFSTDVLGKSVGNVKAVWAQLVFSGRALPPKQAASDDEVKKLVAANKSAIGYVKASSVDDSVKAVIK
jgi:hypothetical protein